MSAAPELGSLFNGGEGVPPGVKPELCKRCRGTGMTFMQYGFLSIRRTCTQCGGTDQTVSSFCRSCNGDKVVRGTKTINLDIMPGVDDGETIKVARCGGADPDRNQNGDLFVTIKAILGGNIQVPTLTGDVALKLRPGTQPGQKVVLKKKGIKARAFGDQFVHFNVSIPINLAPRQRELIDQRGTR